jgi:hypothetical protein
MRHVSSLALFPTLVVKTVPYTSSGTEICLSGALVIASPSSASAVPCYRFVLELRYHSFPSAAVVFVVSCSKVPLARQKSAHDA